MATPTYFMNVQTLKDNTVIDENVGDKMMTIMLRDAENTELQQLLGTDLYKLLKTNIAANTLTAKQRTLIEDHIFDYLYAAVALMAVDYLLVKYESAGVHEHSPDNSIQLQKDRLVGQRVYKESNMNFHGSLIKTYLENNIDDFPAYNQNEEGIPAVKINTGGFFFDDDDYWRDEQYYDRDGTNSKEESI